MNWRDGLLVWIASTALVLFLYWLHTLGWPGIVGASVVAGAMLAAMALGVATCLERVAALMKLLNGEGDEDEEPSPESGPHVG